MHIVTDVKITKFRCKMIFGFATNSAESAHIRNLKQAITADVQGVIDLNQMFLLLQTSDVGLSRPVIRPKILSNCRAIV